MKVSLVKKSLILIILSTYFTTQVALGSLAEANIWGDRRKAIEQQNSHNENTQVASLPSQFNNPQSILKQMPAVGGALPTLPKWSDSNKKLSLNLPKRFQTLIDSIPLVYGSIQDVYDSGNEKISPVVLIQDVHMNSEAQTNIASVLQELIDQRQVGLVGVEGAFTPFDFSRLRSFPDKQITKEVAEDFLNKNLLAAPSFVGINSQVEPPLFVGVDDREHYQANVEAYLSTVQLKQKTLVEIKTVERNLLEQKKKVFSAELRSFDEMRMAYHKGKMGLGEYVKKIAVIPADAGIQSSAKSFVIEQFLAAYEMESSLDFKKVDQERRTVIENLTKVLKKGELSDLLAQSLTYRMGRLSFGTYYQNLKNLCESKGISLRRTPAFDSYIQYVLLSDGIKGDKLFASVAQLEENILSELAKTSEEKELAELSEHVTLMGKLVDFSLTPTEWEKYSRRGEPTLKPFESFYEQADIRSHKMLANLLNTIVPSLSPRLLICGGFHTPQIASLLKDQKISYVVVSPKITKIEEGSGSAYLSVFSREKTPLDKLFAGEKLFLNSEAVNTSYRPTFFKFLTNDSVTTKEKLGVATNLNEVGVEVKTLNPVRHLFKVAYKLLGDPQPVSVTGGGSPANYTIEPAKLSLRETLKEIWSKVGTFLNHPLGGSPILETALLHSTTILLKSMQHSSTSMETIGISVGVWIFIALLFPFIHPDQSKKATPNRWSLYSKRFLGGLLLTFPLMMWTNAFGFTVSLILHEFWNLGVSRKWIFFRQMHYLSATHDNAKPFDKETQKSLNMISEIDIQSEASEWFYKKKAPAIRDWMVKFQEGQLDKADFIIQLTPVMKELDPGFEIQELITASEPLTFSHFTKLLFHIIRPRLIQKQLLLASVEVQEGSSALILSKILASLTMKTYDGNPVTVYFVEDDRGVYSRAMANNNYIVVPLTGPGVNQILKFIKKSQEVWNSYPSQPEKFSPIPTSAYYGNHFGWIQVHFYGRPYNQSTHLQKELQPYIDQHGLSIPPALWVEMQDTLAEEFNHWDSIAFANKYRGPTPNEVAIAESILKPEEKVLRGYLEAADADKKQWVALAIIEVESSLKSMWLPKDYVPDNAFALLRLLNVINVSNRNPLEVLEAHMLIDLVGASELDDLLEDIMGRDPQSDGVSSQISKISKSAYEKHFLSTEQRRLIHSPNESEKTSNLLALEGWKATVIVGVVYGVIVLAHAAFEWGEVNSTLRFLFMVVFLFFGSRTVSNSIAEKLTHGKLLLDGPGLININKETKQVGFNYKPKFEFSPRKILRTVLELFSVGITFILSPVHEFIHFFFPNELPTYIIEAGIVALVATSGSYWWVAAVGVWSLAVLGLWLKANISWGKWRFDSITMRQIPASQNVTSRHLIPLTLILNGQVGSPVFGPGTIAWFWHPIRILLEKILLKVTSQQQAMRWAFRIVVVLSAAGEGTAVWAAGQFWGWSWMVMGLILLVLIAAHAGGFYSLAGKALKVQSKDIILLRAPPAFWWVVGIAASSLAAFIPALFPEYHDVFLTHLPSGLRSFLVAPLVLAIVPHLLGNLIFLIKHNAVMKAINQMTDKQRRAIAKNAKQENAADLSRRAFLWKSALGSAGIALTSLVKHRISPKKPIPDWIHFEPDPKLEPHDQLIQILEMVYLWLDAHDFPKSTLLRVREYIEFSRNRENVEIDMLDDISPMGKRRIPGRKEPKLFWSPAKIIEDFKKLQATQSPDFFIVCFVRVIVRESRGMHLFRNPAIDFTNVKSELQKMGAQHPNFEPQLKLAMAKTFGAEYFEEIQEGQFLLLAAKKKLFDYSKVSEIRRESARLKPLFGIPSLLLQPNPQEMNRRLIFATVVYGLSKNYQAWSITDPKLNASYFWREYFNIALPRHTSRLGVQPSNLEWVQPFKDGKTFTSDQSKKYGEFIKEISTELFPLAEDYVQQIGQIPTPNKPASNSPNAYRYYQTGFKAKGLIGVFMIEAPIINMLTYTIHPLAGLLFILIFKALEVKMGLSKKNPNDTRGSPFLQGSFLEHYLIGLLFFSPYVITPYLLDPISAMSISLAVHFLRDVYTLYLVIPSSVESWTVRFGRWFIRKLWLSPGGKHFKFYFLPKSFEILFAQYWFNEWVPSLRKFAELQIQIQQFAEKKDEPNFSRVMKEAEQVINPVISSAEELRKAIGVRQIEGIGNIFDVLLNHLTPYNSAREFPVPLAMQLMRTDYSGRYFEALLKWNDLHPQWMLTDSKKSIEEFYERSKRDQAATTNMASDSKENVASPDSTPLGPLAFVEGQSLYRNPPLSLVLPADRFNVSVDLKALFDEVVTEVFRERQLLAVTGSTSYLSSADGTVDWDRVGDIDLRIHPRIADSDISIVHEVRKILFARLRQLGVAVKTEGWGSSLEYIFGELWGLVDQKTGDVHKIELLYQGRGNLFEPDGGAYGYQGTEHFFGDVSHLDDITRETGSAQFVERAQSYYREMVASISRDVDDTELPDEDEDGNKARIAKHLYQLAVLRGRAEEFRWLVPEFERLVDRFSMSRLKSVLSRARHLTTVDDTALAEVTRTIGLRIRPKNLFRRWDRGPDANGMPVYSATESTARIIGLEQSLEDLNQFFSETQPGVQPVRVRIVSNLPRYSDEPSRSGENISRTYMDVKIEFGAKGGETFGVTRAGVISVEYIGRKDDEFNFTNQDHQISRAEIGSVVVTAFAEKNGMTREVLRPGKNTEREFVNLENDTQTMIRFMEDKLENKDHSYKSFYSDNDSLFWFCESDFPLMVFNAEDYHLRNLVYFAGRIQNGEWIAYGHHGYKHVFKLPSDSSSSSFPAAILHHRSVINKMERAKRKGQEFDLDKYYAQSSPWKIVGWATPEVIELGLFAWVSILVTDSPITFGLALVARLLFFGGFFWLDYLQAVKANGKRGPPSMWRHFIIASIYIFLPCLSSFAPFHAIPTFVYPAVAALVHIFSDAWVAFGLTSGKKGLAPSATAPNPSQKFSSELVNHLLALKENVSQKEMVNEALQVSISMSEKAGLNEKLIPQSQGGILVAKQVADAAVRILREKKAAGQVSQNQIDKMVPVLAEVLLSMTLGKDKVEKMIVDVQNIFASRDINKLTKGFEFMDLSQDRNNVDKNLTEAIHKFNEVKKENDQLSVVVFGTERQIRKFKSRNKVILESNQVTVLDGTRYSSFIHVLAGTEGEITATEIDAMFNRNNILEVRTAISKEGFFNIPDGLPLEGRTLEDLKRSYTLFILISDSQAVRVDPTNLSDGITKMLNRLIQA